MVSYIQPHREQGSKRKFGVLFSPIVSSPSDSEKIERTFLQDELRQDEDCGQPSQHVKQAVGVELNSVGDTDPVNACIDDR